MLSQLSNLQEVLVWIQIEKREKKKGCSLHLNYGFSANRSREIVQENVRDVQVISDELSHLSEKSNHHRRDGESKRLSTNLHKNVQIVRNYKMSMIQFILIFSSHEKVS